MPTLGSAGCDHVGSNGSKWLSRVDRTLSTRRRLVSFVLVYTRAAIGADVMNIKHLGEHCTCWSLGSVCLASRPLSRRVPLTVQCFVLLVLRGPFVQEYNVWLCPVPDLTLKCLAQRCSEEVPGYLGSSSAQLSNRAAAHPSKGHAARPLDPRLERSSTISVDGGLGTTWTGPRLIHQTPSLLHCRWLQPLHHLQQPYWLNVRPRLPRFARPTAQTS